MSTSVLRLRPQHRLDGKWLKIPLENVFQAEDLSQCWNELVVSNELCGWSNDGVTNFVGHTARKGETGLYYCGARTLTCSCCPDGLCGPSKGCNCIPCQMLDKEDRLYRTRSSLQTVNSSQTIHSWTWQTNISTDDLLSGAKVLLLENTDIAIESSRSTPSTSTLSQRLVILERYFTALSRQLILCHGETTPKHKSSSSHDLSPASAINRQSASRSHPHEEMKEKLAKVGSQAMLSFAFAFLKRIWRSGEDTDLCCELLQECTDIMRLLPDACLFDNKEISQVWFDMMTRTSQFLRAVITGNVLHSSLPTRTRIPTDDQRKALALYSELAIQRGSVTDVLDLVLLLWDLWQTSKSDFRNKGLASASLVPLINRFEALKGPSGEELPLRRELGGIPIPPTTCFLRYLHIPRDNDMLVDLQQTSVTLMCHIDRLISPYIPQLTEPKVKNNSSSNMSQKSQCEVYGWGWLAWNLGADLRTPQIMESLSDMSGIKQLVCSINSLHVLTSTGRVYYINYSSEMQTLESVDILSDQTVVQVASHYEGRHYLALTATGAVYSWGSGELAGEHGQLGHGSNKAITEPKVVDALRGVKVVRVVCGPHQSAAVTESGELYTWGQGQGPNQTDQSVPTLLHALRHVKVHSLSFGVGESSTLVMSNGGRLFGSENSKSRNGWNNDLLIDIPVKKVTSGDNFSVVLSRSGHVYSWGSGADYRLGHGTEDNQSSPKIISAIKSRVANVWAGSKHCIAITEKGQVYMWGTFDTVDTPPIKQPQIIEELSGRHVAGAVCGSSQSFVFVNSKRWELPRRVPYLIDLCPLTFELIDEILGQICSGMEVKSDWPPPLEKECVAVSTLNLLNLQLMNAIHHGISPEALGLTSDGTLLPTLRNRIVSLATNNGVLKLVQRAAQNTLQNGWSYLLPTAEERSRFLLQLLPSDLADADEILNMASGQKFLIRLLINSLLSNGGLEQALQHALDVESKKQQAKEILSEKEPDESNRLDDVLGATASTVKPTDKLLDITETSNIQANQSNNTDIIQLVQQLLRLIESDTTMRLEAISQDPSVTCDLSGEVISSISFLQRFQRLLLAKLIPDEMTLLTHKKIAINNISVRQIVLRLLEQYTELICTHVADILPVVISLAGSSPKHFQAVSAIIKSDITGSLFNELVNAVMLLHTRTNDIFLQSSIILRFEGLLDIIDRFNQLAPGAQRDEADSLSWPGSFGPLNPTSSIDSDEDIEIIRQEDIENQTLSGGLWVIIHGNVYDVKDILEQEGIPTELSALSDCTGLDASDVYDMNILSPQARQLLNECFVGVYEPDDEGVVYSEEELMITSPLIDTERTLAILLGLHCRALSISTPLQQEEVANSSWLESVFLRGGLHMSSRRLFAEKADEGSLSTGPGSSDFLEASKQLHSDRERAINSDPELPSFLLQANSSDNTLLAFLSYVTKYMQLHNMTLPINFAPDHPVEEVGRLLMAVLLKHLDMGLVAAHIAECGLSESGRKLGLPRTIANICKAVYETKRALVKVHQDTSRSYKEICAPIIERCHFLFKELRPACGEEVNSLNKSKLIESKPRWQTLIQQVLLLKNKDEQACSEDTDAVATQVPHSVGSADGDKEETNPAPSSSQSGDDVFQRLWTPLLDNIIDENKKQMVKQKLSNSYQDSNAASIISQITQFLLHDGAIDIQQLRKSLHLQVERAEIRLSGIQRFLKLVYKSELLQSVKYNLLSGWLGLLDYNYACDGTPHCLDNVGLIPPCDRVLLQMLYLQLHRWCIDTLRTYVLSADKILKQRHLICSRYMEPEEVNDSLTSLDNESTSSMQKQVSLASLPHSRFIICLLSMLSSNLNSHSVSLLVNSGVLALTQSVLRLAGSTCTNREKVTPTNSEEMITETSVTPSSSNHSTSLAIIYDESSRKNYSPYHLPAGDTESHNVKVGSKVVRGKDWKWQDQDGGPNSVGTVVSDVAADGWVRVLWPNGDTNSYRMGKDGKYDLKLADVPKPSHDSDEHQLYSLEDECVQDMNNGAQRPSSVVKLFTHRFLQLICINSALHSNQMPASTLSTLSKHLITLVSPAFKSSEPQAELNRTKLTDYQHLHVNLWLQFTYSLSSQAKFCQALAETGWVEMLLYDLKMSKLHDVDLSIHVLKVKLLQNLLTNWIPMRSKYCYNSSSLCSCEDVVSRLFGLLSALITHCNSDPTVAVSESCLYARKVTSVPLTATYTSTLVEQLRELVCCLHKLSHWTSAINSYITEQLSSLYNRLILGNKTCDTDLDQTLQERTLTGDEELFDSPTVSAADGKTHKYGLALAALVVLSKPVNRVRIGGRVSLNGESEGLVMRIGIRGRLVIQFPSCRKLLRVEDIETVPSCSLDIHRFISNSERLMSTWSGLLSYITSYIDNNDMYDNDEDPKSHDPPLSRYTLCYYIIRAANHVFSNTDRLRSLLLNTCLSLKQSVVTPSPGDTEANHMPTSSSTPQKQLEHTDSKTFDSKQDDDAVEKQSSKSKITRAVSESDHTLQESTTSTNTSKLLLQTLLSAATQPLPIKAVFQNDIEDATGVLLQYLLANNNKAARTDEDGEFMMPRLTGQSGVLSQSMSNQMMSCSDKQPSATAVEIVEEEPALSTKLLSRFQRVPKKPKIELPPSRIVGKLMEMGFSRSRAEIAINQLSGSQHREPTMEMLVNWLLEHESESLESLDAINSDSSADSEDDDTEIGAIAAGAWYGGEGHLGSDSCESLADDWNDELPSRALFSPFMMTTSPSSATNAAAEVYRARSSFANMDEYARYIKQNINVGMNVVCCESYEDITKGDIGTVLKIDNDGLHDLNVFARWQRKGGNYWVRFVHIELMNQEDKEDLRNQTINIGDRVRVKPSVTIPRYKWGSVTHSSIGTVNSISANGRDATIDFPQHAHWTGLLSELELVPSTHSSIMCEGCGINPIVGHRYKCQICSQFNYCQSCFNMRRHRSHVFNKISTPTSVPVYAGPSGQSLVMHSMPPSIGRRHPSAGVPGTLIEDWSRCVRNLTVSSKERQASRLYDSSVGGCWQSSGRQGQHWIRLEMMPDICIARLTMTIDPQDGSYMPSKVRLSAGTSFDSMKEVNIITMSATGDKSDILLLQDIRTYYKCIEIAIIQCKNSGIDCKIHNLTLIGRVYCDELETSVMAYSFLAIDNEEGQGLTSPAAVENTVTNMRSRAGATTNTGTVPRDINTHVFSWGLNDKEQLGGPKGSKVKLPVLNESLSSLKCAQIAGGAKSLFCVTQDGKVYACGEATNGRLGLGLSSGNIALPKQLTALGQYVVKKIAVHSGGRHALALTVDGKVFSWGEGDDGKLGHFSRMTCDTPRLIEYLRSKRVRDIACGSAHSACITSNGELYTWGLGEYGRLGHGDNTTQLRPKQVKALQGQRVVQVACGSRDAQSLALTEEGLVYSWGDGDFGKLGRGGSEGCSEPQLIETLRDKGVIQIECGAQFSVALTKVGEVWTWGKGDYHRLGHGTDNHVRRPQLVEGLKGKKVVHVAIGALHSLAVTDTGQVYAWGDNDHGQQGNGGTIVNKKPCLVQGLEGYHITRVACGSSHSVAWATSDTNSPISMEPVSFTIDRDPLGAHQIGLTEKEDNVVKNNTIFSLEELSKPSLAKIVLSLETNDLKRQALNHLIRSQVIDYARQTIISALYSEHGHTSVIPSQPYEALDIKIYTPASYSPMLSPTELTPRGATNTSTTRRDSVAPDTQPAALTESSSAEVSPTQVNLHSAALPPEAASLPDHSAASTSGHPASLHPPDSSDVVDFPLKLEDLSSPVDGLNSSMAHTQLIHDLEDFISQLTADDARMLVDLLKLAIANRTDRKSVGVAAVSRVLYLLNKSHRQVADMLMEVYITDLEDIATSAESIQSAPKPVVVESTHPYADESSTTGRVRIPGAECLRVEFDKMCSTERNHDPLEVRDGKGRIVATLSGREWTDWNQDLRIAGEELTWKFTSDSSVNGWGWRFTVYPLMPSHHSSTNLSDRTILSKPSMELVISLLDLDIVLVMASDRMLPRLAASLAVCAQLSTLPSQQRMWALNKLRQIMTTPGADYLIHQSEDSAIEEADDPAYSYNWHSIELSSLVKGLPETIMRQYKYEDAIVKSGKHLSYSPFFKVLVALACDLMLDLALDTDDKGWSWLRQYCIANRISYSLYNRKPFPKLFIDEVKQKISELDSSPQNSDYENNLIFNQEIDSQLIQWINRYPNDWKLAWGGDCQIFGWGHNHRGQLGGIEGAKVRIPTACESLAKLTAIQVVGGEQTLFIVTSDGRVYATGYGAGSRLGVGGTDSVAMPTLIETLQTVSIVQVAVNAGGKHSLALSSEGEVFSWGEPDDGKLGHGNRLVCEKPKVIEALRGKTVVKVAAGGAHSACVTSSGELYTWGKGRYGRLGHGDSEDQLRPKLVEALQGYKVLDVACGSGDAQTLCITSDGSVWSWGDGDYGKLGRGGSDGCKTPQIIDKLEGKGIIRVECGSQFSVALSKDGTLYTWGKGDYHRLGHGSDDHVRWPKQVTELKDKHIVDIACGSLHCVAVTDDNEVYTWGDNDEGQLGDGTTNAIQRPKLVAALQGKKINLVACGSAHSVAWSTSKPESEGRVPAKVPMEFNHLNHLPIKTLRNRLVLLHHFSDLFCSVIPMVNLSDECVTTCLRYILISQVKESLFRKVIQTTMIRDKQHGPVVELNRYQVKKLRGKAGPGSSDGMKTVFGQLVSKISMFTPESLLLPHRIWKVKFVGESVDDCGGGYSESVAEICEELQNGYVNIICPTPNGRSESGANRDCLLLNPSCVSKTHQNMFTMLGMLIGIAVRTGSPLSLSLAEPVWKQLVGSELTTADITEVDKDFLPGLMCIKDMSDDILSTADLSFSTSGINGQEVHLSSKYDKITPSNRHEYIKLAIKYRLHECDEQVRWLREGMAKVIPLPLLSLFTGTELEMMACGSPEIPLNLLKSVATYKGVEVNSTLISWFWQVMEEFSNTERSLFLRFVWGRTRLPRTVADFRGRDFVLQVLDKYDPPDDFLPESYTCFFLLKMPRYTSISVLRDKLKYAIHFCKSIDTDEYARIALGDTEDAAGDDDSDDDDDDDDDEPLEIEQTALEDVFNNMF